MSEFQIQIMQGLLKAGNFGVCGRRLGCSFRCLSSASLPGVARTVVLSSCLVDSFPGTVSMDEPTDRDFARERMPVSPVGMCYSVIILRQARPACSHCCAPPPPLLDMAVYNSFTCGAGF